MARNIYQPMKLSDGRWVTGLGGSLSKTDCKSEIAKLNTPAAKPAVGDMDFYTPAAFATANVMTVKSVERYENALARATICKRCGSSTMDGVMFTNGSDTVCDDCF